MNKKEISQIKRRTTPERSTATKIFGFYATPSGEVISDFSVMLGRLGDADVERYFGVLRDILSPRVGEKTFNIEYSTHEVTESTKHKLLMKLLDSKLEDESARKKLYENIAKSAVEMKDNYLVLLECETMDVPAKSEGEDSEEMFTYMLCSICPVKQAKEELSYNLDSKEFCEKNAGYCAGKPTHGFMFPAISDGHKDIYGALYFAKKVDDGMSLTLLENVMGKQSALTSNETQSERFANVMQESLGKDCTMELVDHMRETVYMMQANQDEEEKKYGEQVTIGREAFKDCLMSGGISEEQAEQAADSFEEMFGEDTEIPAAAVVDTKKYQVKTPYCRIIVDPEQSDKVTMKSINGVKYIMIQTDGGSVELNGIPLEREN